MEEIDPRRSLVNALITLGVVAALAFVGFLVRVSKGDSVRTPRLDDRNAVVLDERQTPPPTPVLLSEIERRRKPSTDGTRIVNRQLVHSVARNPMLEREELDRFEILVGCELLEGRDSSATSLWLAHQGREFIAHFYFAESPLPEGRTGETMGIGDTAWKLTEDLLRTRTARVFTRWQPATEAPGHYFAMIYVEGAGGADRRFLSEILVANGLSDYVEWDLMLPDGKTHSSQFIRRLVSLEQMARAGGRGAWGIQHASVY